ncbi:TonB-dependent receptor [Rhodocytophaga rosea]|uniref:TonB-dependent receptor n=2 Tax=Rhodocytophaga rosea TaxID=2704465 RepID=A0A6C0GWX0_9BACT|nr:TonB-dependent receptor [Rhodocytophaga rosea]
MLSCLLCLPLLAQESRTIKGRVLGENNEALPGVNVTVKGTTNGTVTDTDGQYSLSGFQAGANPTLVFSFIGYVTEELSVDGRSEINITLVPDIKSLGEVVVVGYGTQRKVETTGAIASVKSAELTQTPVVNVAQGLQARTAGVQITQNSAAPGGNISVRIRGTNSINGTSEPLYVVDGIQISNGGGVNDVSPLSTINPNDIESVEVLKDASATAIYGARGSNGVILITTKRGKAGVTRVTYDGYYGVQQVTKQLDVLNAIQYAELENEVYKNNPPYADPSSLGEGTNWQDLVMQDSPIQSHQLSVAGGSEKTQLAISANYFNQGGVIIESDFKRYSLRLNLDHQISNKVKIGTSILGSYSVSNRIPTGSESIDGPAVTSSIVGAALGAPPVLIPYKDDGSIFPFGEQSGGTYRELANPLGLAAVMNRTAYKRTLANLYADFSILQGLTYRASFNVDMENRLLDYYSPRSILSQVDLASGGGSAEKTNSNYLNLLHESILTYSTTFADQHTLKFTGVFATQSNQFDRNTINASKFPNDVTANEALQLAIDRTVSSDRSKDRLDSYMGRVNYGFRDKYFLDLTARYDGASKFGKNHKYGFFPAASAAWRVIEEGFLKDKISFLSDLKLRASYGATGNAGAIGPYQSLATVGASSGYSLNHNYNTGLSPSRIPNANLRWEKSIQTDIGLDIGLLQDRINLIVDFYDKHTKDLLFVKGLPQSSGYGSITGNFAEIRNRGIELSADAKIMDGAFKWNVNGNFSVNRNELVALEGGLQEFTVNNYAVLKVGEPIGIFKTYVNEGIYQTDEPILPGSGSRTGGAKVSDLNGDGQITADDQAITGNANPDFIFGFSTNMSFKNFDLSAFISGVQGNEIYNLARYTFENPLGQRNMFQGIVNRWSPTNPNNEYVSGFQGGRLPISDRFMEDGSYIRLKNITLGYTLPKVKFLYNARVYVSANNLFTITDYTGFDPEVNTFGNTNTRIGVDNGVYPLAKSFIGGVQVTF